MRPLGILQKLHDRVVLVFVGGSFSGRSLRISAVTAGLISSRRRPTSAHDLKPRLAKCFFEAGKDVAVVAFGADFVFAADDQHVALQGVVDAADDHGDTRRRSISSSSKPTSTCIKVSVTHHMIPSRAAIRYGVTVVSFVV